LRIKSFRCRGDLPASNQRERLLDSLPGRHRSER